LYKVLNTNPIDAGMDSLIMWAKTEPLVNEGVGWAYFKTHFED